MLAKFTLATRSSYVDFKLISQNPLVSVETESAYEPQKLPLEAIGIMRDKITTLRRAAEGLLAPDPSGDGDIDMADT